MKGVGGWHNQSSFAWVLLGLMLRLLEVPNCIPCKPAHVFILQRKRSCNFDTLKYEHLCVMQSVRLSASTCYVCLRELFLFSQSLAFEGKRCSPVGRLTELFRLSGRQRTPHSYFSAHFIFFFSPFLFQFPPLWIWKWLEKKKWRCQAAEGIGSPSCSLFATTSSSEKPTATPKASGPLPGR